MIFKCKENEMKNMMKIVIISIAFILCSCASNKVVKQDGEYKLVAHVKSGEKVFIKKDNKKWKVIDRYSALNTKKEAFIFDHENKRVSLEVQGEWKNKSFCRLGLLSLIPTSNKICYSSFIEVDTSKTIKSHASILGLWLVSNGVFASFIYMPKYNETEIYSALSEVDTVSLMERYKLKVIEERERAELTRRRAAEKARVEAEDRARVKAEVARQEAEERARVEAKARAYKRRRATSSERVKIIISIKEGLKDPYSLKVHKITVLSHVYACVSMNAKNSYGGYIGIREAMLSKIGGEWFHLLTEDTIHEECLYKAARL